MRFGSGSSEALLNSCFFVGKGEVASASVGADPKMSPSDPCPASHILV